MNNSHITLNEEQSVEIVINNIKLVIKHNDIGTSIDVYSNFSDTDPVSEFTFLFDDFDNER